MKRVRRYDRGGGRGLGNYGKEPLRTSYGHDIEISDSSSAEGPHVWLRVSTSRVVSDCEEDGQRCVHMNRKQVTELIRRLETWLERSNG